MTGKTEILLYQTEDGQSRVEGRLENETVWLTQAQMVELFQITKQNISLHIRIRDIRSSEKIFYAKIKDIYATSIDYSPDSEQAQLFFASVQNKMHWAIHGYTAAEVIFNRANAGNPNMGLTFPESD